MHETPGTDWLNRMEYSTAFEPPRIVALLSITLPKRVTLSNRDVQPIVRSQYSDR